MDPLGPNFGQKWGESHQFNGMVPFDLQMMIDLYTHISFIEEFAVDRNALNSLLLWRRTDAKKKMFQAFCQTDLGKGTVVLS